MRLSLSSRERERERERVWLEAVEAGQESAQSLSQITGLSVRRIQERLARARAARSREREGSEPELPILSLINHQPAQGDWYDLSNDQTSRDGERTNVLVNDHHGRK